MSSASVVLSVRAEFTSPLPQLAAVRRQKVSLPATVGISMSASTDCAPVVMLRRLAAPPTPPSNSSNAPNMPLGLPDATA